MPIDDAERTSGAIRTMAVAVMLVAVSAVVVACSAEPDPRSSPEATPTSTDSTTTSSSTTTTWLPPEDDPTQPSPAAVAADREFRAAPADIVDCGVHARTSGWPTTAMFGTDLLDCILDAAATGTPAQFVTTARDFEGGMEGSVIRVLGPDEVLVIDYGADPQGTISSTETTCTGLVVANFPIPECG